MDRKRVVIIGGGAAGLVAAHIFKQQPGADVTVVEPGRLGGEYIAMGGLRYLIRTDAMVRLVNLLDVPYSVYQVRGGILLRGKVHTYPECLKTMEPVFAQRIREDHYRKTRKMDPSPEWSEKAMNDPGNGPQSAIRCDHTHLMDTLAAGLKVVKAPMIRAEPGLVHTATQSIPFDFLVPTISLEILRDRVWFRIPDAHTVKLNIASVAARGRDPYVRFDYVYTPYTPESCVHRISPWNDGYAVESNGMLDESKLTGDLSFIFPEGHHVESIRRDLKGHLLPLAVPIEWPKYVAPLGRFAQWDPRATLDVVLNSAIKLARKWFA